MHDHSSGQHLNAEINQQPDVLEGLVNAREGIAAVGRAIAQHRPRFVLLAARGSSDHAALYAKYLIEVSLGLPTGLVSPSTTTLYEARPDLRDVLLLTVSQSGGSDDLLEVTEMAKARGALTVVVTNNLAAPLPEAAHLAVDVRAGQEHAVAATKTYTATLLTLYLLIDAVRGGTGAEAGDIGALAARTLRDTTAGVEHAVDRYRFVQRVVATARGYSYATARESALKLAETSYLSALAYSGADLLHGPIAAVDSGTAVLAVTGSGPGGTAMDEVLDAVLGRGADVLCLGSAAARTPAAVSIPVPRSAEELAPILEILPVQRLALHLARDRGFDPDHPRGLHKVTRTR